VRARHALLLGAALACSEPAPKPPITVFAAASLARPLAAITDSFQRRSRIPSLVELGGSMELSRRITDLGRAPDVLMLVDDDVIAALMPSQLDWYVRFATNRIVVTYSDRSRFADSITADNWWQLLSRPGVRVGRADPVVAPVGRHALAMLGRVDTYYSRRGLGDTLLARAPLRYVRPNATELAALLETGEVDYMLDYESVARQYGFKFIQLPQDLSPAVLYGIAVPRLAKDTAGGAALVAYILSDAGQRVMRDAHVQLLSTPVAIGANVPPAIAELVRTTTDSTRAPAP
jgi:molybdate/tungstate transport system substrate-binding protein